MAAPSRALSWFLGSRLRIAAALALVAVVAIGVVVLRDGGDGGGQQVDASSSMVRAGRGDGSSTSTTSRDGSSTTAAKDAPRPRAGRGPMHIVTKKAREAATRPAPNHDSLDRKRAHSAAQPRQATPTTAPRQSPPPSQPSQPSQSTTTTTAPPSGPPPSTTTTTTPPKATNGRLVAVEKIGGADMTRLVTMAADGSGRAPVTDGQHVDAAPTWSPDGTRIAFDRVANGAHQLFVIAADGSGLHAVTTGGSAQRPVWSPDGARLAFLADAGGIRVVDIASNKVTTVADDAATADTVITWAPDGSLLAWAGDAGIVVAAPDGTGRKQLTSGDDHDPAWNPDGSRLLVRRGNGVVTVDRNGAVSQPIASDDGFVDLEWAPDGSSFVYDCDGSVCARHLDGSARAVLAAGVTDADWAAAPSTTTATTTQP